MTEEQRAAVAMSYLGGVGPIRARRLLARAGGFVAALTLPRGHLAALGVSEEGLRQIHTGELFRLADRELEWMSRHGIEAVDCLSDAYPTRLSELTDAPIVLYAKGSAGLNHDRVVAIVGTRSPTPQGIAFCEQLVDELHGYGATVVSGLAYGVDVAAHRASLRAGAPTLAVLAHGLGEIYPAAHRATAAEIVDAGSLLTEYPSAMRTRREFFPQRNRIVAGLSDATVVVESKRRGGSMITATLSFGYDRALYAVPGRVGDPASEGCNALIRTHRASLLTSAREIAEDQGWLDPAAPAGKVHAPELFPAYTESERRVIESLRGASAVGIDTLGAETTLASGELSATLLELEFRGLVRCLPGKQFSLT